MPQYAVIMYNIPKVSEDGKQALPIPQSQTKEFSELQPAKSFAAGHNTQFDRVVLMQNGEEGQKLIERFVDGRHELAENIVRR